MELKLDTFQVKDVAFGDATAFDHGILQINKRELKDLIMQDSEFDDVDIEIAHPGDDTRIIHIVDIVDARCKVDGGMLFPGILGPQYIAGQGTTHRLAGLAIMVGGDPIAGEPVQWREAIVDMSGPAAAYSPFSQTINIVLTVTPRASLRGDGREIVGGIGAPRSNEYNAGVRLAAFKASAYLGQTTQKMEPDQLETYRLGTVPDSLPRVAFAYLDFESRLYSEKVTGLIANLVHPNELFDGAVVNDRMLNASKRNFTYFDLNNGIVNELYRRHGKDVNFMGMVLFGGDRTAYPDHDRVSTYAANLLVLMKPQGVIISPMSTSYHGAMVMLLCQKLEKMGIKTVIVYAEATVAPGEIDFTHSVPEAVAMISTGNSAEPVMAPAVKQVIGGSRILITNQDAAGRLEVPLNLFCGANNRMGSGKMSCQQY